MDKDEEYALWADPTVIELGDKDYAERIYTGQKGDRPILVGLKELPILVTSQIPQGRCNGRHKGSDTEQI